MKKRKKDLSAALQSNKKKDTHNLKDRLEALTKLLEFNKALIKTMREPLIVLDQELKVIMANRSFYQTFKVSEKETENNLIYYLGNSQWDIPDLRELLEKIIPQNSHFDNFEVEHDFPSIGKKVMLLNARKFHKDGAHILLAIEDITERKQIENKLKKSEKQKTEVLRMTTHELKTPITAIKAYTQILEKQLKKNDYAKSMHFLQNINFRIDKLTSLVNDFLDVSKIETGKLVYTKKEFDLDRLIEKVVLDFQYISEKHQIKKIGRVEKMIMGDPDRIEQILINLLTNAIKYSLHANEIIVRSELKKDNVIISVQDFGMGIPMSMQKKIFDKYSQVSETSQEGKKGFGLGLFITAEIVKRHGGEIWVESEENKGSTFTFTIPLKQKKEYLV